MANEILLSSDKTRQLLHISKRKCAWMLKNGIIPCKISGKKTRCYEVRLSDLEKFVNDSAKYPEDYIIPSIFSSKPSPNSERYEPTPPDDFRPWLTDYWFKLPEMLSTPDVEQITGYCQNTVSLWISSGKLRSVTAHGVILISPEWLIDFMCGYGWRIVRKSEKHRQMLNKYLQER